MTMLEKRFYPRQEIAEIVGITNLKDRHFAEKVRRYLDNRGYEYEYSTRGANITRLPQTAEEQLAFLLRDSLGLDVQINAYDFACFIKAFSVIRGFDSMPWASRTAFFNQHFNNEVSQATLQRWIARLTEKDKDQDETTQNMMRFKKGALWRTFKDEDGSKVQVWVDPDTDEYREYCEKRSELLIGFSNADKQTRKDMWGAMVQKLYPEYGVYYYCPQFVMNALGEHAEEISRLVAQVMAERQEGNK